MKYFFSFSDTLHSLFTGKISLEELAQGSFLFGRDRQQVIGGIPNRLVHYNKEKANTTTLNPFVPHDHLDADIQSRWNSFLQLLLNKDKEGAIIWQKRADNYPRRILEFLKAGNEVFFNGVWQKLEWYKWLDEEKPKKKKAEDMMIEEIAMPRPPQYQRAVRRRGVANPPPMHAYDAPQAVFQEMPIPEPEYGQEPQGYNNPRPNAFDDNYD